MKEEKLEDFDYIIVATKNVADVPPSVAEIIAPAVANPMTAIVLIQNGLNIEKPLVEAFPDNPILSGITFMGAKEKPAGYIKHTNKDISLIVSSPKPYPLPSMPSSCRLSPPSSDFLLLLRTSSFFFGLSLPPVVFHLLLWTFSSSSGFPPSLMKVLH